MKKAFNFDIEKKLEDKKGNRFLGRVGTFSTAHGDIKTPAFATVGTKATVKGLTPEMLEDLGSEIFLANTYHLYFSPGDEIIGKAGGLHKYANWNKPMMTDSGGFQAFSLGAAFGTAGVSKIAKEDSGFKQEKKNDNKKSMAKITEDGVEFRSYKDGSKHLFTPEKSMQIQQNLGADILFAFDECTGAQATYDYQKEAMERTHRWAIRSLDEHTRLENKKAGIISKLKKKVNQNVIDYPQALFGVVQGGRHTDLRTESAKFLGAMDFHGYGVGGSFDKDDMDVAVKTVNENLPEDKPRHLLGIGEPIDFFMGVENGCDFFDCVAPSRMARHGSIHTRDGKVTIKRKKFIDDFGPLEKGCECYACKNYTRSFVCHALREGEMIGSTLATVHNLYFVVNLVKEIRQSILDDKFFELKKDFLKKYYK